MKKIFVSALVACFLLTGCGDDPGSIIYNPFSDIKGHNMLSYDKETLIVYYNTSDQLAPYYSENGKLCRYIDGEIVEIGDDGDDEE